MGRMYRLLPVSRTDLHGEQMGRVCRFYRWTLPVNKNAALDREQMYRVYMEVITCEQSCSRGRVDWQGVNGGYLLPVSKAALEGEQMGSVYRLSRITPRFASLTYTKVLSSEYKQSRQECNTARTVEWTIIAATKCLQPGS